MSNNLKKKSKKDLSKKGKYSNFLLILSFICLIILFFGSSYFFIHNNKLLYNNLQNIIQIDESDGNIENISFSINYGDKFINKLMEYKVPYSNAYSISSTISQKYDLKKIKPNQIVNITYNKEDHIIKKLSLRINNKHDLYVNINHANSYDINIRDIDYKKYLVRFAGGIEYSIYHSMIKAGISHKIITDIEKLYSTRLNLKKSINQSSNIDIIFERYEDVGHNQQFDGDIIYISLMVKNNKYNFYRYSKYDKITKSIRHIGYFDQYGKGIHVGNKLFSLPLKINAPISSKFGYRIHPILRRKILHKGIDYAVSKGTSVYASADGIINFAKNLGGYGKAIQIKHSANYTTMYAHLSSYRRNIKKGAKVYKGDLIGYSGDTGNVTGAHLHYEMRYKDKAFDPGLFFYEYKNHYLNGKDLKDFIVQYTKFQNNINNENNNNNSNNGLQMINYND